MSEEELKKLSEMPKEEDPDTFDKTLEDLDLDP